MTGMMLCHFLFISSCCNLIRVEWDMFQSPCRQSGNFVFHSSVTNPLVFNVYSLAQYSCIECIYLHSKRCGGSFSIPSSVS